MKFILGQKLEMSQIFKEEGKVVPVTLIEAGPCKVVQVKTKEKDGYQAVQVGFKKIEKKKKITKTMKGKEFRYLKEFREGQDLKAGDTIDVSVFNEGDKVKVAGISKGKGFQGGVKRWGFSGRGASHGVKHEARTLGSTGSAYPQRVIKGRKMPGRTGYQRITVRNLEVVKIDKDNNIMAVKGAIPGRRGTLVEIRGKE
jgi:large subunit ribosomal protein L3